MAASQIDACKGQPNTAVCTLPDDTTGGCLDGVCLAVGCGNGVVEAGEVCDDGNALSGDGCSAKCDSVEQCGNGFLDTLKGEACDCGDASLPDAQRPPGCSGPNSDAEGSVCLANCKIRGCGDGIVSGLEDCEAGDLRGKTCGDVGFYGGTLACSSLCRFDVTACTGKCGDGVVDGPPGAELCDGTDLGGKHCTDFGFYDTAGLKCNSLCGFDTSSCTGRCGDGMKNGTELCDGNQLGGKDCTSFGFYSATGLACTTACNFDTSACSGGFCGDNMINSTSEHCDGTQLNGKTCSDFGFYQSAGLACSQICDYDTGGCTGGRCGDGTKNGPELCDTTDLGGRTCTDYGFYSPTGLACTAACGISTAGCNGGFCGDGIVQTGAGEQCDGNSNLNGGTCQSNGFYTGTLACGPNCKFNVAACSGKCGDGVKNGTEVCDGSDFGGQGCANYGFYTGSLACNGTCSAVVTTGCSLKCGDGIKNGAEACDGTDVGGLTCGSFGFYGGNLACNGTCSTVLTTSCMGKCGDGIVNGAEDCDGTNFAGADCTDFGYYDPTTLKCTSLCAIDESSCTGYCGDRVVNGPGTFVEQCDAQQASTHACLDLGYESGAGGCRADCGVDISQCVTSGWYSIAPTNPLYAAAVWGSGPTDVWLVGYPFYIRHWNGRTLTDSEFGGVGGYHAVWGSASNNVFVVGDGGTIKRWNGTAWQALTSGTTTDLTGVWGDGSGNVFAVGYTGVMLKSTNNGSTWAALTNNGFSWAPTQGGGGSPNNLNAIWGSALTNIYVVGDTGTILHSVNGGTTWTVMTTPNSNQLNAITGLPSGKVYVSGLNGTVWELTAGTWSPVTTNTNESLLGIWAASTSDIFAAGTQSVFHFDGSSWTPMQTNTSAGFFGIWGSVWNAGSPPDVYAVGPLDTVIRYNGEAWKAASVAIGGDMNALWGSSASDVWAVGPNAQVAHFDGTTWSGMATSGFGGSVYGVWGSSPTNIFVVGDNGKYMRYTGTWSAAASTGTANQLRAITGFSATDIFAVGASGTIVHWNGSAWSTMTSTTTQPLSAVWGTAGNDVYAVGYSGTILHYNGTAWSAMTSNTSNHLAAIWGSSNKDIYATALSGELYHYDGTSWNYVRILGINQLPVGIWGSGPHDIYFVGSPGKVWHYDGASFSEMRTGLARTLLAVWGSGSHVFIGGSMDTILHRARACSANETACGDNKDDDCDGLIDCADPDCTASNTCTSGGLCAGAPVIACNATTPDTLAGGTTNLVVSGCDEWERNGREQTYRISRTTTGTITVFLTNLTNDVDLQVMSATNGGACNPYGPGCIRSSAGNGTQSESVTFTAQANTTYYIVVDSYGSYGASFNVQTSCP